MSQAGGRAIAVLGSGIDVIYPPENKKLFQEIQESGAVVSEFAMVTEPHAVNFRRRNRIISGLSHGVPVVQVAEKSGSLITAEFALEQNREVFAVPGNAGSRLSRVTNRLIKKGAKLVSDVDDMLEEIQVALDVKNGASKKPEVNLDELPSEEKLICEVLLAGSLHIDQIIKQTNLDSSQVLSNLMSLELKVLVDQMPGKYFKVV